MKQFWIDTNIFIRFFVKDQESFFSEAKKIFTELEKGNKRGIVSILVVNEVIWILERYYKLERPIFLPGLIKLLAFKCIKILEVKKKIVISILEQMRYQTIDFTDLYLLNQGENLVTFDKQSKKLSRQN